jgi:hypothetical protein
MKEKKGQIGNLQSLIIPLVAIGVVLAIGFLIMAEVQDQTLETDASYGSYGCNATEYYNCSGKGVNATGDTITAIAGIPGWLPIIIITIIGSLLIGLVSMFRGR